MSLAQRIVFDEQLRGRVEVENRATRRAWDEALSTPCPTCGLRVLLRPSMYGGMWACERWPTCDTLVGAHRETLAPMGTPADRETRQSRIVAHDRFDRLWLGGHFTRSRAYAWLTAAMGGPSDEPVHIGSLDIAGCERVVQLAEAKLREFIR